MPDRFILQLNMHCCSINICDRSLPHRVIFNCADFESTEFEMAIVFLSRLNRRFGPFRFAASSPFNVTLATDVCDEEKLLNYAPWTRDVNLLGTSVHFISTGAAILFVIIC